MLKAERQSKDCASEIREGETYVSNIHQEKKNPDITKIPSAADTTKHIAGDISNVTFDLETGGFIRTSDILQISAFHGSKQFNR